MDCHIWQRVYCCKTGDNTVKHYSSDTETELVNGDYCIRVSEDLNGKIWILFAYNGLYYFDKDSEVLRKVKIKEICKAACIYRPFLDNQNYFIFIIIRVLP